MPPCSIHYQTALFISNMSPVSSPAHNNLITNQKTPTAHVCIDVYTFPCGLLQSWSACERYERQHYQICKAVEENLRASFHSDNGWFYSCISEASWTFRMCDRGHSILHKPTSHVWMENERSQRRPLTSAFPLVKFEDRANQITSKRTGRQSKNNLSY